MHCVSASLDYNMTTSVQFFELVPTALIAFCKCFHISNASFKSLPFLPLRRLPDINLFHGCYLLYVYSLVLR